MSNKDAPQQIQEFDILDQSAYLEDSQLETLPDPEFIVVTRSLSQIMAHERPLKPIHKEQEIRQKIRKVPVQRRAAGDPITSIRQINNNRRR